MSNSEKPQNQPISPAIRLVIATWPDDAPRGAVSAFCAEHEVSRQTFYRIRRRSQADGEAAALEPQSRRPHTSPTKVNDGDREMALQVRQALLESGWDHGPITVHDKMVDMGLDAPSTASLSRIFHEAGVAGPEPRKKPRSAFRRFVYPRPNDCWQLDATSYPLASGRSAVIFQLVDDHSRKEIASHVAGSENARAALRVFKKGVEAHGVPQRLLSDNGVALNAERRGWATDLTDYARSLGVEPITGKPGHPTTQGKNERLHQTLFAYLNAQPLARNLSELQAQVDAFDHEYNTTRRHQGLPERMTPDQAYAAIPKAPEPERPEGTPDPRKRRKKAPRTARAHPTRTRIPQGERDARVGANGVFDHHGSRYNLGLAWGRRTIHLEWDTTTVSAYTLDGTFLITYPAPRKKAYYPRTKALDIDPDALADATEESPMS